MRPQGQEIKIGIGKSPIEIGIGGQETVGIPRVVTGGVETRITIGVGQVIRIM